MHQVRGQTKYCLKPGSWEHEHIGYAFNMQIGSTVIVNSEAHPHQGGFFVQDGGPGLAPSTSNHVALQQPGILYAINSYVTYLLWAFFWLFYLPKYKFPPSNCCEFAVKKPTRQWAAWTHQEEESFFAALRQVGKACSCPWFFW